MSFQNFIPTIWNKQINLELERLCVFAEDCNRQYEGDVKELGDQVKILGVGKPTITTITRSEANNDIGAAESITDTSIFLQINQLSYFHYIIGDIDKAQAVKGITEAIQTETSEELANTIDQYIAGFSTTAKGATLLDASAVEITATSSDAGYVLTKIDEALQKLYENDVKQNTDVILTCSPRFYFILKRAYVNLDTDNHALLKNGFVGQYGTVKVKMSNNVLTANSGAEDLIQVKTTRAIAFVHPYTHSEAYRPDLKFADAIKGYILYDAKIVRPKEMIVINAKYA